MSGVHNVGTIGESLNHVALRAPGSTRENAKNPGTIFGGGFMIHVKVTKQDIRKGRLKANDWCGCPIWEAMSRSVRQITSGSELNLEIPDTRFATLGRFKLLLPKEAQNFQQALIKDFSAKVKPFAFDADVVIKRRR
jgi:hypothetical protein